MRRCQQDRVDGAVREHVVQPPGQGEVMLRAKPLRRLDVGLYCADDLEPFVTERGFDQIAAPAAEADDCGVDHLMASDATGSLRNSRGNPLREFPVNDLYGQICMAQEIMADQSSHGPPVEPLQI